MSEAHLFIDDRSDQGLNGIFHRRIYRLVSDALPSWKYLTAVICEPNPLTSKRAKIAMNYLKEWRGRSYEISTKKIKLEKGINSIFENQVERLGFTTLKDCPICTLFEEKSL